MTKTAISTPIRTHHALILLILLTIPSAITNTAQKHQNQIFEDQATRMLSVAFTVKPKAGNGILGGAGGHKLKMTTLVYSILAITAILAIVGFGCYFCCQQIAKMAFQASAGRRPPRNHQRNDSEQVYTEL